MLRAQVSPCHFSERDTIRGLFANDVQHAFHERWSRFAAPFGPHQSYFDFAAWCLSDSDGLPRPHGRHTLPQRLDGALLEEARCIAVGVVGVAAGHARGLDHQSGFTCLRQPMGSCIIVMPAK
jgi:hypothetical protein